MTSLSNQFAMCASVAVLGFLFKILILRKNARARAAIVPQILLNFTLPAVMFKTFAGLRSLNFDSLVLIITSLFLLLLCMLLSYVTFRLFKGPLRITLTCCGFCYNIGAFFYPLMEGIGGEAGMQAILVFDFPNCIALFALLRFVYSVAAIARPASPNVEKWKALVDEQELDTQRKDFDQFSVSTVSLPQEREVEVNPTVVTEQEFYLAYHGAYPTHNENVIARAVKPQNARKARLLKMAKTAVLSLVTSLPLYAMLIGPVFGLSGITLPSIVLGVIDILAKANTLIAYMHIGIFIDFFLPIRQIVALIPLFVLRYTTGIIASLAFYFLTLNRVSKLTSAVLLISPLMPVPVVNSAFALEYGLDHRFATAAISLSLVLSFVLIWVFLLIFNPLEGV